MKEEGGGGEGRKRCFLPFFPTPSPLFYLCHFSRGLWLSFLVLCSWTARKRLLLDIFFFSVLWLIKFLQWKVKGFVVWDRSVPSRETLNFRLLFMKSATVSVLFAFKTCQVIAMCIAPRHQWLHICVKLISFNVFAHKILPVDAVWN